MAELDGTRALPPKDSAALSSGPVDCIVCGAVFLRTRTAGKPQVCCSRSCASRWSEALREHRGPSNVWETLGRHRTTTHADREAVRMIRARRAEVPTQCASCASPLPPRNPGPGRHRLRCLACAPVHVPNEAKRERRGTVAACANQDCGKPFPVAHASAKYCSPECRIRAGNAAQAARAAAEVARLKFKCKYCGVSVTPTYGSKNRVFCSQTCKKKYDHLRAEGNTHRARAKKFGGRYEPINRWSVFERDGWRCQLCGVKTPRTLSGSFMANAPTLDHIVPLALGGDHVPENVQLACWACNNRKGAKPAGQLQLLRALQ